MSALHSTMYISFCLTYDQYCRCATNNASQQKHKPATMNDLTSGKLYMREAKELNLQFYRHRPRVSPSMWSTLIIACGSTPSLPVDLLLQHGGTGGVWSDNAVLQCVALHHAQINETELASPHTHEGLYRRNHQPLHSQAYQDVLNNLHQSTA